jgi:hypothetical protein
VRRPWTGSLDNPSAASAIDAMAYAIVAASGPAARGHASRKRRVIESDPGESQQARLAFFVVAYRDKRDIVINSNNYRSRFRTYGDQLSVAYGAYRSSSSALLWSPHRTFRSGVIVHSPWDCIRDRSVRPSPSGVELEDAAGRSPAQSLEVNPSENFLRSLGGPPGRSRRRLRRAYGLGTGYGTRSLSRYASYLFGPGVPERQ